MLSLVAFGLAVAAGGAALGGISAPDSSAAAEGEERRGLRRRSFFVFFSRRDRGGFGTFGLRGGGGGRSSGASIVVVFCFAWGERAVFLFFFLLGFSSSFCMRGECVFFPFFVSVFRGRSGVVPLGPWWRGARSAFGE
jgi:hypothetical protein